jgi:hypothetical protein
MPKGYIITSLTLLKNRELFTLSFSFGGKRANNSGPEDQALIKPRRGVKRGYDL